MPRLRDVLGVAVDTPGAVTLCRAGFIGVRRLTVAWRDCSTPDLLVWSFTRKTSDIIVVILAPPLNKLSWEKFIYVTSAMVFLSL